MRSSLVAYDGGTTVKFYVDGSVNETAAANYDYAIATLHIGSSIIGGTTTKGSLHGMIDEVTLWNHALDANEASSLWGAGSGCVP